MPGTSGKRTHHFGTRLFSGLKYTRPFSIDRRERGSHARGVYPYLWHLSHTGYLAHGNSKGEARGRHRHKNNS